MTFSRHQIDRRNVIKSASAAALFWPPSRSFAAAQSEPATTVISQANLTTSEKMMHATVRIICPIKSTNSVHVGTGFIYSFPAAAGLQKPVIVTNKHVLNQDDTCLFTMTGMKADGTADFTNHLNAGFSDLQHRWIGHPDPTVDIAILPIAPILNELIAKGTPPFFSSLDRNLIPSDAAMKDLAPLDPIVTMGYPEGIMDDVNNLPVFHSGVAATPPYVDFQGRPDFLIDIATWPGSSGSPVFLYKAGMIYDPRAHNVTAGERILLLGIIYKDFEKDTSGKIEVRDIPSQSGPGIRNPMNIGMCVKSRKILDFEPIMEKLK